MIVDQLTNGLLNILRGKSNSAVQCYIDRERGTRYSNINGDYMLLVYNIISIIYSPPFIARLN